ncbi:peptidoglycan-binding protein [Microbaculum marinum]|uniref:Lysozyme n=1 Tax=Microbaculum marinum TaxID=1764581 RepID=A0AAW9RCD1_9HYPH
MTVIRTASPRGVAFISQREGRVLRAYRCPAGVITIGDGFTMRSKVFASWWRGKHGRDLRLGDTITAADSAMLLEKIINEEYGAAVAGKVKPELQHQFDGSSSMTMNCGTGALDWRWAKALAQGNVAECARLLRVTGTTANGRRLAGLVRRRADEARLIETGDYGVVTSVPASVSQGRVEVREYQQQLAKLGHYSGGIDGLAGPKTRAAMIAFQRAEGLTPDGIVGPATRAALIRALDRKAQGTTTTTGAGGGAVAGGGTDIATSADPGSLDALWTALMVGAGVAVLILVVFLIWRYRGRFTGRRVPT